MTNELKQTAIGWFLQKIEEKNGKEFSSFYSEFIDEAEARHKDELLYSWIDGVVSADSKKRFEDYYNKTFNK